MSAQEESRIAAFCERAGKAFDLRVGNIYQRSIHKVRDLKNQYLNEGIVSGGKYLQKAADIFAEDFQGIEPAFNEIYLQPFSGTPISNTAEFWLRRAVDEVVDRETTRVRDTFYSLASSYVGAANYGGTLYSGQFDQLGQLTKKRLNIFVDLLKPAESVISATQAPTAQHAKKRHPWLPGDWEIQDSLSEGGQGWTYLVRQATVDNGPLFVLKRLRNPKRADRLEAEIKALKKLSHPGILTIVDSGEADGKPYYVAEYCENGDLSKWDPAKATLLGKLRLFRQISDAVSAAHGAGIIHRDLKPSNILMRSDGSTVVGDFGLCIHLNDMDGRLTTLNEAVGPRNYIAPELEDGRLEDPEPSADVYSLVKLH